jgi:hypothetical protein
MTARFAGEIKGYHQMVKADTTVLEPGLLPQVLPVGEMLF